MKRFLQIEDILRQKVLVKIARVPTVASITTRRCRAESQSRTTMIATPYDTTIRWHCDDVTMWQIKMISTCVLCRLLRLLRWEFYSGQDQVTGSEILSTIPTTPTKTESLTLSLDVAGLTQQTVLHLTSLQSNSSYTIISGGIFALYTYSPIIINWLIKHF